MAKTLLPETRHRCHSKGHEGCWDGIHTFERCCGVQQEMPFASSMDEFVLLICPGLLEFRFRARKVLWFGEGRFGWWGGSLASGGEFWYREPRGLGFLLIFVWSWSLVCNTAKHYRICILIYQSVLSWSILVLHLKSRYTQSMLSSSRLC